ncbi:hypothetical protein NHX12_002048 [Muraenolepis orangiensis]|uniref:Cytochrome P450 n=1 Tax=Muraenolepis orangiensis TaxID=630683 RepID=A0A9Q0IH42_9TELE|nr:hypothetical protein NHX12_002048 [Muraenolepis orangiensis]
MYSGPEFDTHGLDLGTSKSTSFDDLSALTGMKRDGTELDKTLGWAKNYPFAFPIWFGPFLSILNCHHPHYIKTVVSSSEPKDDIAYRFIKPWIGDGLLVTSGQKWFSHRRLLTPGFHFNILKPYVKLTADCSKVMLDKWEGYSQTNELFEVSGDVSLMSLDNIMKCAFSNDSNCQNNGTNVYIKAVYELSHLINTRLRIFPYHSDIIFYLSPHGFRFRRACRVTHRHTERIQAKRNLDFLDILLCARDEDQKALSDEAIRAEVDTFMFEGHDTTASGISFLLYSMASHPQHQKICREEILQVLGDRETLDWDDLNRIPYTTMCIKESLRLYPPVPGVSRKLTKTMTFFDGRSLPEGYEFTSPDDIPVGDDCRYCRMSTAATSKHMIQKHIKYAIHYAEDGKGLHNRYKTHFLNRVNNTFFEKMCRLAKGKAAIGINGRICLFGDDGEQPEDDTEDVATEVPDETALSDADIPFPEEVTERG